MFYKNGLHNLPSDKKTLQAITWLSQMTKPLGKRTETYFLVVSHILRIIIPYLCQLPCKAKS